MRRVSFGLESGSQRLLDLMNKGSSVEGNSEFIRNAHEAGLSIRCTMFKGFPGETAEDMEATADFLEAHSPYLDRVRFNDFSLLHDTPIFKAVMEHGGAMDSLTVRTLHDRRARAEYRNPPWRAGATGAPRRGRWPPSTASTAARCGTRPGSSTG